MRRLAYPAGFTIIEMLVAITLMALMGIVCWRGLAFVGTQRASIADETLELSRMFTAFAQIERDVAQRLPDIAAPARATTPELPLALTVLPVGEDSELDVLRMLEQPDGASLVVPVRYERTAAGLLRRTPGGAVLVLPGIARLKIRIHVGGFWIEPGHQQPVRPVARASALEISLQDENGARYVKVIAL
jgi:prepilin-type N-terminal cleavage/methylation domain-containing protein